ncbi:MAG: DUF1080 domain-containing protein [Bacteroidetes bacterium]|nr:DUF1080 domain-containing protein [Bacteroidota bacterium]
MKTKILSWAIILVSVTLMAQERDNTLSPADFASGWSLLFDGETLRGWKAYNGDEPQTWKVDENALFCDGSSGGDDIMTVECFGDFDLKFEWKIEAEGNSGVIYLTREGRQWNRPYLTGLEYQVHDEEDNFSINSVGSVYDVYAPSHNKKVNPALEWNSGRIRLSKGMITHWVNGELVVNCQLYSDDWDDKVAASKWKDNPFYGKSPFGHIDFQNHGSQVWYKNVKILRL